MSETLSDAIRTALLADRVDCADESRLYSWEACTNDFLAGLESGSVRLRAAARQPKEPVAAAV